MAAEAVLLAETDPRTLISLPRVLSESLPHIHVHTCTTADSLRHQSRQISYDTVGIHPLLMDAYRCAKQKKPQQLLAPLLLMTGPAQHHWAQVALERDAFDLLAKPIIPLEAVHTVRLALWENRSLRLLTTKDQAASRVRVHMAAFPQAQHAEAQFMSTLAAFDRTFEALQSSMRLLLKVDDEHALFDVAASVETLTRQRAMERLLIVFNDGSTQ